MSDTPTLHDICCIDTQEMGKTIRDLTEGDRLKVTNNRWDFYAIGIVVEKIDRPNDKEIYVAILEQPDGEQIELMVNWQDIPPDSDDQETPYTGAIIQPFDDTAPEVTDLMVLNRDETDTNYGTCTKCGDVVGSSTEARTHVEEGHDFGFAPGFARLFDREAGVEVQ